MTLSLTRHKDSYGYDTKNYIPRESPSITLARRQNEHEEELGKQKLFKLERETSATLIKLCKNIYETNIELNQIKYELNRNKLETIYKNYNYCASHRNMNKIAATPVIIKPPVIEKKSKNGKFNGFKDNSQQSIKTDKIEENNENKSNKKPDKDARLAYFLNDISTKTQKELDYLLVYRAPSILKSRSTTALSRFSAKSNNITIKERAQLIKPKLSENEAYKINKLKVNNKLLEKGMSPIETIARLNSGSNIEIIKSHDKNNNALAFIGPRSVTPSLNSNQRTFRERRQSLPKLHNNYEADAQSESNFDKSYFNITDVDNEIDCKSLCSSTYQIIKKNDQKNLKDFENKTSTPSRKQSEVLLARTTAVKSKPSKTLTDDLYDKSVENLERMSLKYSFNNSLDDDEWAKNMDQVKAKQREKLKKQRIRYRACLALTVGLGTKENLQIASLLKRNRQKSRSNNYNTKNHFDMVKEAELFEMTHKNLKDLMLKQIYENQAKRQDKTVKEYLKKF